MSPLSWLQRLFARLPWPLPALLAWAAAWSVQGLFAQAALAAPGPWLAGVAAGVALALAVPGRWRQLIVAGGFPLSALALGWSAPAWAWVLAAAVLLLVYPLRAWTDAPFFPTPVLALHGLGERLELLPGARVLDAGCGLGHGLRALHAQWPQALVEGVEWSLPMARWTAWRCGFARVRRGDMWVEPWQGYRVVYLFQRPESMPRAWTKACAEMDPGSWLLSLEFPVPGVEPAWQITPPGAGSGMRSSTRPVWAYRIPDTGRGRGAQRRAVAADKTTNHLRRARVHAGND